MLNKIKENNEINIKVIPFFLFPNNVLNSLWSLTNKLFQIILNRFGINQKIIGIKIRPIKILIQLSDILKILVEGSKTEKRFVIIFNLKKNYCCFYYL